VGGTQEAPTGRRATRSGSGWTGGRRGWRGYIVSLEERVSRAHETHAILRWALPTEEHVLEDNGLLGEATKVAVGDGVLTIWHGLLLDAGPGKIHVKEQQQDAEADDGRVELVVVAHQGVVQQVAVDLGLDEHQVDEEHDVVMLDVFVAEATAVPAHGQADVVAARLVAGARVLCPQRLDRVTAFYADRHRGQSLRVISVGASGNRHFERGWRPCGQWLVANANQRAWRAFKVEAQVQGRSCNLEPIWPECCNRLHPCRQTLERLQAPPPFSRGNISTSGNLQVTVDLFLKKAACKPYHSTCMEYSDNRQYASSLPQRSRIFKTQQVFNGQ
jgi:hypothetical protein